MVDHSVILRGVSASRNLAAPLILQRTDEEFIDAVLDTLSTEGGIAAISNSAAKERNRQGALRLFQPVHRTFHIALLEIACDTFGQPRLDPERIESAGLVVRRIGRDERGQERLEGWVQGGRKLRGWIPFTDPKKLKLDPDPTRRQLELRSGNEELDRRLAFLNGNIEPLAESVSPLFTAPPDVCKATRRTILYGVVPVTSSELSESPNVASPYDEASAGNGGAAGSQKINDTTLNAHLPYYLRAGGPRPESAANKVANHLNAADADLKDFVSTLRQLRFEFDAFGDSRESKEFFDELNRITLNANTPQATPLGNFLKLAARALVDEEGKFGGEKPQVKMPATWPVIDTNRSKRLLTFVRAILKTRLAGLTSRQGRFDDLSARFRVCAFVRVKSEDGCPPKLIWSEPSEPFAIVPWYETGNRAPAQVPLPNPFDKDFMKSAKPSVAFGVPKDLFNFLNGNDPKKLMDGEGNKGSGPDFDWICGFNIPFITICAFIVLNIFLQLFNIIFQWLLLIKICIPIPRRQSNG